jgi:integrase
MLRSTKETDRKVAFKLCQLWEEAGVKARRKELSAAQGRKIIAEMVAISSGEQMRFHSVEGWLRDWIQSKLGSTARTTAKKYAQVAESFIAFLGSRAEASLASVSPADIARFRDKLRSEGRTVETANLGKAVLNIPFEAARRQGVISFNPVGAVDNLRSPSRTGLGREAFSPQEVSRLVHEASGDWQGMIILGATSGLRLTDIANLRWESVDLESGLLRVATGKTGAVVILPIHPDFASWLSGRPRGIGRAAVFPELTGKRTAGDNGLSHQFGLLVEKAGIVRRITPREGKGRTVTSKTFHSLRHFFVSQLANSGVASELRQRLVGHSDSGVHKKYTHHELQVLRDAVGKLPFLAGPAV